MPDRPESREEGRVPARIAYVSTYPPRRCGIATFTRDLASSAGPHEVVALEHAGEVARHPVEVHHRVRRDVVADYAKAARFLRDCGVDVVSIQHEYGIWGADDGVRVLDFVAALDIPAVATLHTVLRHPTDRQRRILSSLVRSVSSTAVMSTAAAELLADTYDVGDSRIEIIPHGVPDLHLTNPATAKPLVGLADRRVLLSFGLLGPGKGYELAIDAMPEIVAAAPDVCYVVLGATHPEMLAREGEAYRERLTARAASLGVADQVRFVNRFVGMAELGRWLQAADIFITPYPNLEQIVSGTLTYAMAAGRTVVSTPYAYALELLARGRGVIVPPASPGALATTIVELLNDPERRTEIGRRAWEHTRPMVWPRVGAAYATLFEQAARAPFALTHQRAERGAIRA
jgi:glycosyltransferase involved in cell wall biosynthesis